MKIDKYVDDGQELRDVAEARTLRGARILLDIVGKVRDELRKEAEDHPQLNDNDLRKDMRYRLGQVEALNRVLRLPDEAAEYLNSLPDRSGKS
jgi:hypothetical protein